MAMNTDSLDSDLARQLRPAYLVAGDEPLLVAEAADAIRARARQEGYASREVLFVEPRFDWQKFMAATQALSLFAERRILELRLPTPKPGTEGSSLLSDAVVRPAPDLLVLVITNKLEWADRQGAWVKAFESHGALIEADRLPAEKLPAWITARMRRAGLEPDADAAELLAERVEGNLVAAHQEIERLVLNQGQGRVDLATIASAVANSARFNVLHLSEAVLAGDVPRTLRVLEGLRGEGEEPTYVLWTLCEELRAILQWAPSLPRGAPARLFRGGQRRQQLLARAARRLGRPRARELLSAAAQVDLIVKGVRRGNVWDEFTRIAVAAAGLKGMTLATA